MYVLVIQQQQQTGVKITNPANGYWYGPLSAYLIIQRQYLTASLGSTPFFYGRTVPKSRQFLVNRYHEDTFTHLYS
jgi:hypothetical protein